MTRPFSPSHQSWQGIFGHRSQRREHQPSRKGIAHADGGIERNAQRRCDDIGVLFVALGRVAVQLRNMGIDLEGSV